MQRYYTVIPKTTDAANSDFSLGVTAYQHTYIPTYSTYLKTFPQPEQANRTDI